MYNKFFELISIVFSFVAVFGVYAVNMERFSDKLRLQYSKFLFTLFVCLIGFIIKFFAVFVPLKLIGTSIIFISLSTFYILLFKTYVMFSQVIFIKWCGLFWEIGFLLFSVGCLAVDLGHNNLFITVKDVLFQIVAPKYSTTDYICDELFDCHSFILLEVLFYIIFTGLHIINCACDKNRKTLWLMYLSSFVPLLVSKNLFLSFFYQQSTSNILANLTVVFLAFIFDVGVMYTIFANEPIDIKKEGITFCMRHSSNIIIIIGTKNNLLFSNRIGKKYIMSLTGKKLFVAGVPDELKEHIRLHGDKDMKTYEKFEHDVYQLFYETIRSPMGKISGYAIFGEKVTDLKNSLDSVNQKNNILSLEKDSYVKLLKKRQILTIDGFTSLIEGKSCCTGEHIKRTKKYMRLFAGCLLKNNVSPEIITPQFVETLTNASPLHDLGKIVVPDSILEKQGPLTNAEFEIMKQHVYKGASLFNKNFKEVFDSYEYKVILDVIYYHHEKWNGTGYIGIKGERIPMAARIMGIIDAFDAIVSVRPYKQAVPLEVGFARIAESAGTHFDPILVKYFLSLKDEIVCISKLSAIA